MTVWGTEICNLKPGAEGSWHAAKATPGVLSGSCLTVTAQHTPCEGQLTWLLTGHRWTMRDQLPCVAPPRHICYGIKWALPSKHLLLNETGTSKKGVNQPSTDSLTCVNGWPSDVGSSVHQGPRGCLGPMHSQTSYIKQSTVAGQPQEKAKACRKEKTLPLDRDADWCLSWKTPPEHILLHFHQLAASSQWTSV